MRVSIKCEKLKLTLPVPLFMGSVIIRFIPKNQLNYEQKKMALELFKVLKCELKGYKGLKLLEVQSQSGEYIAVTI